MSDEKPQDCYTEDDLVEEFKDLDQHLRKHLEQRGLDGSLEVLTQMEATLERIKEELKGIDHTHQEDVKRNRWAADSVDLAAGALALMVVRDGLREVGIYSDSLDRLFSGLQDLHMGASPAGMFLATESKNRRPDAANIQFAKGAVAAIVEAKQKVGRLGREGAAKWVLKNISTDLCGRLSIKPITARTLIEWLDRYGGKSGGLGPGRSAFLQYSRVFLKLSDIKRDDCASFTNGLAKKLPALKSAKHRKPLS